MEGKDFHSSNNYKELGTDQQSAQKEKENGRVG